MRRRSLSHVILACGLAFVLTASVGLTQEPPSTPLPEGLRHVPPSAMAFVHFRIGDFLKSANGAALMTTVRLDRDSGKMLQKMEKAFGLELAELESITVVLLTPPTYPQQRRWEGHPGRAFEKRTTLPEKFFKKEPFDEKKFEDKKFFEEKKFEEKKDAEKNSLVSLQDTAFAQPEQEMDGREIGGYQPFSGPLFIATSTRPLDRKKILRAGLFGEQDHRDEYADHPSTLFLSDRSLLVGDPSEIARYSELTASGSGLKPKPLQSALVLGANRHLVVAGGHLPLAVRRNLQANNGPDSRVLASVLPLLQSEAGLTLELGKSADLTLQFHAQNDASADLMLEAVKTLRVLAELGLEKAREGGEPGGWRLTLERSLKQCLADLAIEKKGTTVRAQLKVDIDPALFRGFAKEFLTGIRSQGDRTRSINNLKQIGLAMHNYHDTNKYLPPAGISDINDPNGKPLLSWRVAILPYIEQSALYNQFNLALPWDHPHNKKLIERMPEIYILPGAETKEAGLTHYRVLVGPGTMFEPRQGRGGRQIGHTLVSITDGTSNTIMAVEAAEPTIWTRPDDLPYDPKGPLPKLGVSKEGFHALFGDATVRFFRSTISEDVIRACITRNGGEAVQLPD